MFRRILLLAVAGFALLMPFRGRAAEGPAAYDYFVLALTWSPTYCAGKGRNSKDLQCSGKRPYAFVLHGLWPQFPDGRPKTCPGNAWVPEDVLKSMLDIMPARGLVIHEYRTHGVCSGLTPKAYFDLARRAFSTIKIPARYAGPTETINVRPDQIEEDFIKTNAQLDAKSIAVSCGSGHRLNEVRICLTKDLTPRACGANVEQRRQCGNAQISLPPVR